MTENNDSISLVGCLRTPQEKTKEKRIYH